METVYRFRVKTPQETIKLPKLDFSVCTPALLNAKFTKAARKRTRGVRWYTVEEKQQAADRPRRMFNWVGSTVREFLQRVA